MAGNKNPDTGSHDRGARAKQINLYNVMIIFGLVIFVRACFFYYGIFFLFFSFLLARGPGAEGFPRAVPDENVLLFFFSLRRCSPVSLRQRSFAIRVRNVSGNVRRKKLLPFKRVRRGTVTNAVATAAAAG